MLRFLQEFEGYDQMTAGILRLAEYVHRARTSRGLSLEKLRERGGPSVGWLSSLENGTMVDTPKPATLRKLAEALGEPIENLQVLLAPSDSVNNLTVGSSIHLPELEHLSAAQRDRVEAAAREAAQEEIKKIRSTSSGDAIARMLSELPEDMEYPPTAKELKYLAMIPPEEWEHTELDPRSMSPLWLHAPGGARLNEIKEAALERGEAGDASARDARP